jgi:hypothetical protein
MTGFMGCRAMSFYGREEHRPLASIVISGSARTKSISERLSWKSWRAVARRRAVARTYKAFGRCAPVKSTSLSIATRALIRSHKPDAPIAGEPNTFPEDRACLARTTEASTPGWINRESRMKSAKSFGSTCRRSAWTCRPRSEVERSMIGYARRRRREYVSVRGCNFHRLHLSA